MVQLKNNSLRNIAIVAHVDHGKTTLVDHLFRQSGTFRNNAEKVDRVMDNMDLERERGITITAKNCAVFWQDKKGEEIKINIVDTPGHADFGGEVERALMMVDGVVLLVDSAEGPLPQTRFVLKHALDAGLNIIVCINKIDRSDARPREVLNDVYDLFIDLDATEEQLDFPVLYSIGRDGIAKKSLTDEATDLRVLFETIIDWIPAPTYDSEEPFQMLVANVGYSDYLGRLAIGRISHGKVKANDPLAKIGRDGTPVPLKVLNLQTYVGPKIEEIKTEALAGDIILLAGTDDVEIGDTICTRSAPKALKRISVEEPTVAMKFCVNTSPFAGREGRFVQSRKIAERLEKETLYNVSLQVAPTEDTDSWIVKGRGELQLSVLIEQMRREGYELAVGRPEVIYKYEDGKKLEPIEDLMIDCDETHVGIVTEKLSIRKSRMTNMHNSGSGRVRLEFSAPSRALIGYRTQFLTDTKGSGVINTILAGYEEYRGDFPTRFTGSLVSDRLGESVAYGLFHLEPRGRLLIGPGVAVYEGMIVGEHNRENDLYVNPTKSKKLSNMRAAGKDDNIILTPVSPMSLEQAMEFIREDELVEITPKSLRLRKLLLGVRTNL